MALKVPKGIQGIPADPAWPAWFKEFIQRYAGNSDVRNAVAGEGITISGTIASPATLAVSDSVQALFNEPYALAVAPSDAYLTKYRTLAPQAGVLSLTDGGALSSLTVGVVANGIGDAQIRQGAAASVIGNASDATADVADIAASADGQLLGRSGGALAFSTVELAGTGGLGASFTVSGLTAGQVLRASDATTAAFATLEAGDIPTSLPGLVGVGTIGTGVWEGTKIGLAYGGTNADLSATGGASQVLKQASSGAAVTVGQLAYTDISGLATVAHSGAYSDLSGSPSIPAGANPSASVGLGAVDGSASTFMRSDGAPAIDQSIAPTWTRLHTFGGGASVTGGTFEIGGYSLALTGNSVLSGTNTGDQPAFNTQTGSTYTLVASDNGKAIYTDGGGSTTITVPAGIFSQGNVVQVVGWAGTPGLSTTTIAGGAGMSLYFANGTSASGTRTVTTVGIAWILFLNSSVALVFGFGVT